MARASTGSANTAGLESRIDAKLDELFGMDVRGLAFFRMGFATLIIIDILNRTRQLRSYYTDWGAFPRSQSVDYYSSDWTWSLYLIGGNWAFVAGMFAMTLALAVALFFGYRTRLVTFLLWAMMLSLHNRNPLVLQSGDTLLRMMLFWALFTPLGAALSLNARSDTSNKRVLTIGTVALLVQLLLMYVLTGLLKSGAEWRSEGSAVYYTLQLDIFTTQLGAWLSQFYEPLRLLSFGTLALELLAPLLFLLPIFNVFTRTFAILALVAFHLGLATTLHLGLFGWIAIVALIGFLPTPVWDFLGQKLAGSSLAKRWSALLDILRKRFSQDPPRPAPRLKLASNALGGVLLIYVLLWNFNTLPQFSISLPKDPAMALRLNQTWSMFSPKPATNDGWIVITAQLRGGGEVDLRTGESVTFERPENLATTVSGQRERKYLRNLLKSSNKEHRLYYGKSLCRSWNANHSGGDIVEKFQIHFMKETSLPNYELSAPEQITIWRHDCFK